jgi:rubredoxin
MGDVPENPDRDCNNCGNREWKKFEAREPTDYPDASEVTKHYFKCSNCGGHGFVFEENGHLRYTYNLR